MPTENCTPPNERSFFHDSDDVDGLMTKGMTVVLLILAFVTVAINIGVILRIYKVKKKAFDLKPAFFFIGNLAISDFLIGFYIIIIFCIDLSEFSKDWRDSCCGLLTAISVTVCQETINSIVLVAIDKYVFICHPFNYRQIVSRKKVYISISFSWILSLIIGFLPALGLQEEMWCLCNFQLYINQDFAIVFFVTAVGFPLTIIIVLYSFILVLAIDKTKSRLSSSSGTSSSAVRLSFLTKSTRSSKGSTSTVTTNHSSNDTKVINEYKAIRRSTRKKQHTNEINRLLNCSETLNNKDNGLQTNAAKINDVIVDETDKGGITMEDIIEDSKNGIVQTKPNNRKSDFSLVKENKFKRISPLREKGHYVLNNKTCREDNIPTETEVTLTNVLNLNNDYDDSIVEFSLNSTPRVELHAFSDIVQEENCIQIDNSQTLPQFKKSSNYYKRVLTETKDKIEFLKKCRAIKTVFLIIGLFMATYVPFVIGTLVYKVQEDKNPRLFQFLNNFLHCAIVANSLANPLVYAYGFREFRVRTKNFKGIFAVDKRTRRPR